MWILKNYNSPIPGNYFYVQTEGINHRFDASPIIEVVAKAVSAFRIANHLPRASLGESLQDVDVFNCTIRNNDTRFCRQCLDSFESAHSRHHFIAKGCSGCGLVVTPD